MIIIGLHTGDNKFVITQGTKTFHFDLLKDVEKSLKYKFVSIIKHNKILVEHTTKYKIIWLLFKYKQGNNIYEHGQK